MPNMNAQIPGRQVRCPHCWSRFFSNTEALYIGERGMAFSPETVKLGRFPVGPAGEPLTRKRACPACKLPVSLRCLQDRSIIISIVGAPSAGKSYFLAGMFHFARLHFPKRFGVGVTFPAAGEPLINRYVDRLFDAQDPDVLTHLPKTQEEGELYSEVESGGHIYKYPKPFTMRIADPSGARSAASIVCYDNAGESFVKAVDSGATTRSIDHLAYSDYIILVIDPLQIPSLRSEILNSNVDDPQLKIHQRGGQQEDMIDAVQQQAELMHHGGRNLARVPLAVVVQKWDLVQHATGGGQCLSGGDGDVVRQLLAEHAPNIVTLIDGVHDTVSYFGVSALGTSPDHHPESGLLAIKPSNMAPTGLTDPLEWILDQSDVLPVAAQATEGCAA